MQPNTSYSIRVAATLTLGGRSYTRTTANQGTDDTIDSDGVEAGGVLEVITNAANYGPGDDRSYDFGFEPPATATIGDFVWNDIDADGVQDAGEPGIFDIEVILRTTAGVQVAVTRTDASGGYKFDTVRLIWCSLSLCVFRLRLNFVFFLLHFSL